MTRAIHSEVLLGCSLAMSIDWSTGCIMVTEHESSTLMLAAINAAIDEKKIGIEM